MTQKGWNVPAESPENNAEDYRNEPVRNRLNDYLTDQAYDTCKTSLYEILRGIFIKLINLLGNLQKRS